MPDTLTFTPFSLKDIDTIVHGNDGENGCNDKGTALPKGTPVYFTIDLDVLDSSVFPGTGTPEASGVTFDELRKAIYEICSNCNIVGADINELAPNLDTSGISTAVACKVLREFLLSMKQ